jgi:DNA-binding NarL/FixJ family response regulator
VTPVENLRVLIAEDEALIAEELRERLTRLGASVVDIASTAQEALASAARTRPDLVLMDIRLQGDSDGVEAVRQIRRNIDVAVVYVTAHSDPDTIARAKSTGPCGYVLKPFNPSQLSVAIDMALHQHSIEIARLRDTREARARYDRLSQRERSVFELVVRGMLNKEIATALSVSERTVKAHRARVMKKMHARSVADLTRLASSLGL